MRPSASLPWSSSASLRSLNTPWQVVRLRFKDIYYIFLLASLWPAGSLALFMVFRLSP